MAQTRDRSVRKPYHTNILNQIGYRQCVSCRKLAPKQDFWRVVRIASTHQVKLDRGMGRSAYLCPNHECLAQAKRKNRLQGALRTRVNLEIYQNLKERLS